MKNQKYLAIAFLLIAAVSLYFAISCFNFASYNDCGDWEANKSYGGDAYTGIQNAAAQTANNVYYVNRNIQSLASCIKTISGYIFIIVSLTFCALGVTKLIEKNPLAILPQNSSDSNSTPNSELDTQ